MTLEELKEKLRRQLGNPTTTQYSEPQANDDVISAVNEYSKYRPIKILDRIGTQADQALYSLKDRQRIMRVKEVYYSTSLGCTLDEYWPDLAVEGNLEGISLFQNPSIWTQYLQRVEQYKGMFDGSFDYDRDNKILRLIPVPSSSGKLVVFVWTQRHTPETVPEEDIDDMLLWAKGMSKESMASRKEREIRSVSGFGQSVTVGISADELMKESERLKDKFRAKFGGGSFVSFG